MPYYQKRWLERPFPRYPAAGPATALRQLSRRPFESVMLGQDSQPGLSRRVVAAWGRQGASTWVTTDAAGTLPGGSTAPIWPKWSDDREVLHTRFFLTPGSFLRSQILYAPSGATASGSASNWDYDGARGRAIVAVTWTDLAGLTSSQTYTVDLRPSPIAQPTTPEVPGGTPSGVSREWADMPIATFAPIHPADVDRDNADLRRWGRAGTLAEVTLKIKGGARIIDWVVYEEPMGLAWFSDASDADPAPVGHVANPSFFSSIRYPWESQSDTLTSSSEKRYPQYGQQWMIDVHNAANRDLGPALIQWGAYREDEAATDDTSATISTTSTSWTRAITGSSATTYDATEPGWDIGAAGWSRRWWLSDEKVMPNWAVVPVRLHVRAQQTGGGTGTVRLQAGTDSYVEVDVTSSSMGWVSSRGYLRVPPNPSVDSNVQEFLRVTSGTLAVQAITLEHDIV